jgi:hypothetical protein
MNLWLIAGFIVGQVTATILAFFLWEFVIEPIFLRRKFFLYLNTDDFDLFYDQLSKSYKNYKFDRDEYKKQYKKEVATAVAPDVYKIIKRIADNYSLSPYSELPHSEKNSIQLEMVDILQLFINFEWERQLVDKEGLKSKTTTE